MLFHLLLAASAAVVFGADNVQDAVNEVTTTKEGATWCPVPVVGTQCPGSSIFHYYKCCGDLNKDCCFNLQMWVIVVLAVIAVVMLASCAISFVKCVLCRR